MSVDGKTHRLAELLGQYGRVAVAFSGGTDSAFLLHSALRVLGAGNVVALTAVSELVPRPDLEYALAWPGRNGFSGFQVEQVVLQPLLWKELVQNSKRRCYFCKLRMYQEFLARLHGRDFPFLLDGTNLDDLKDSRPGLQAIHELGVQTPLVETGFSKPQVREASASAGMDSWDKPSGSCLATRIPHGRPISADLLQWVEQFESGLHRFGFSGCRVHLHEQDNERVYIQLMQDDIEKITDPSMRLAVNRFFHKQGIHQIFLDLQGR